MEITPPRSRIAFHLLKIYLGRLVPLVAGFGKGGRTSRELMEYYWDKVESCVPPQVILEGLAEAGFAKPHRHVVQAIMSYTGIA